MPSTTPIRHYPYPLDADPIDTAVDIQHLAEAIDTDVGGLIGQAMPGGTVLLTIAATAPTGWALFVGQTIANAQTLYPELWAVAPATWRSGANLVLPDGRNRVPMMPGGPAVLGAVGGANARTIAIANMPNHAHAGVTTTETANHYHTGADHLHGINVWSGIAGDHYHVVPLANSQGWVVSGQNPDQGTAGVGQGGGYGLQSVTNTTGNHQHPINGATGAADRILNSGGVSANHQHYVYAEGGGQQLDTTPAFLSLNLIVRLK